MSSKHAALSSGIKYADCNGVNTLPRKALAGLCQIQQQRPARKLNLGLLLSYTMCLLTHRQMKTRGMPIVQSICIYVTQVPTGLAAAAFR